MRSNAALARGPGLLVASVFLSVVAWMAVAEAREPEYEFRVVASGLKRPTGVAVRGQTVFFTEVPTPGVGGGQNGVSKLDLATGRRTRLHSGEPEPTNLAVDRGGRLYWTCKSAGVILTESSDGGEATAVLTGLAKPSGISVSPGGDEVYFTEVPTPGVPGGDNRVSVFDGDRTTVLHAGEPEPTDVVVDRDGNLYWTCKSAGVILQQQSGITSVLRSGLDKPVGIALDRRGNLYWTEVPTPGVPGSQGGRNKVSRMSLATGQVSVIHAGDPEPTDVAARSNGDVYWTCSSAGVIVEARLRRERRDDVLERDADGDR
jgi:streptogramin lyase